MVSKPVKKPTSPIRLASPTFEADEIASVVEVLQSGYLVQGPRVQAFEQSVAQEVGSAYAVACSSGTSALHLAILAAGIGRGDTVLVPSYTFPATANMVEMAGADVAIVDIDPRTFNIDLQGVEQAITTQTKAIIGVDLFGLCANWPALAEIAKKRGLLLIADAACALGSTYSDAQNTHYSAGSHAAMATWSFHPRKVITTGEGGMVTTNDPKLFAQLQSLRNHGATLGENGIEYAQFGPNYRMTNMQGALGHGQMKRLHGFIEQRRALAKLYSTGLQGINALKAPLEPSGYKHIYQAYICLLDKKYDRNRLLKDLKDRGIEASIGTYALHEQPYYREKYALDTKSYPGTNQANHHAVALPLHPQMADSDVAYVVQTLKELLPS